MAITEDSLSIYCTQTLWHLPTLWHTSGRTPPSNKPAFCMELVCRLKTRFSDSSWCTNLPVCLKVWIPLQAYAMYTSCVLTCQRHSLQLSNLSYWWHSWMWSWLHRWWLIAMRIPSCLRALWTEQSASLLWPQIVTFGSWSLRKAFRRFRGELSSSVQQTLPHRFAKRREKQNTNW